MLLWSHSLSSGEVPDGWKKANVTPIFKKGKEEDPENNWLVSLLTAPGKIKEQVVIKVISRQNDGQESDWE